MRNKYIILFSTLLSILIVSSGCAISGEEKITIEVNSESEYVDTFKDLNLGILFDFNIKLPNAVKSWVNLWVERYIDGELESEPLTQLSYGNSPNKVQEGHLGFGMINTSSEEMLVFLYGPSVRTNPERIEKEAKSGIISGAEYAIGNDKVELELGETKILGVYREKAGSMRTFDFQDEDSINQMIQQDDEVLLLKIKLEERIINY
ncbi:hypothetical protein [Solibacillus sp. FSL W8-0372]|uniref:hypothetical protein n=1 Tax=Solibacillus sp. FSL W8-0372 TaxID=2921713 RepID=UPI0030D11FEB